MKRQWNKIIHDRMKDFQKKAPKGLLNDIKSEMLHRGLEAAPVLSKQQPFYYRAAAIVAIFLLLFGLSYQWIDRTNTSKVVPTLSETKEPVNETTVSETNMTVKNNPMAITIPKSQKQKKKTSDNVIISNDIIRTEENKTLVKEEQTEKKKSNKEKPVKKKTTDTHPNNLLATTSKRKNSSLAAGISFSGIIAQGKTSPKEEFLNTSANNNPNKPSIPQIPIEKERHHLPIKLGVSFRYNIHERWSIQSGLTYSCLISDFAKGNLNYDFRQTKQKLHYIGIPLQVGFHLWKSNRFNSYIAVGGQAEKLVSGKATTNFSVKNEHRNTSTKKIHDKKLLYSGLASIGIEYSLIKNISMYVEPNIQYYFKNGNELKTHYNDKPININITAGFRFHWNK